MSLQDEINEARAGCARLEELLAMQPTGIDVSHHSGSVNWQTVVDDGHNFAFVRIAHGDVRDGLYLKARVDAIRAAGLRWGPYYFASVADPSGALNNNRTGRMEAAMAFWFAWEHGWDPRVDFPLAYDLERQSFNGQPAEAIATQVADFVRGYRAITDGQLPIIYTNPDSWSVVEPFLANSTLVGNCPLWIADWRSNTAPEVPPPWSNWVFWQYEGDVPTAGVQGLADLNRFNGDIEEFLAWS